MMAHSSLAYADTGDKAAYAALLQEKTRRRTLKSLKRFARKIPVPGVPLNDMDDEEEDKPMLCTDYLKPAEHHDYILGELQKAVEGGCRNIMLFLPPGSAKSTYGSIVFTAWFMGRFPKKNVIHCTYGTDFSRKIGRKTRAVCRTREFHEITGAAIAAGNDAVLDWSLDNGSTYMGAGIQSGVTGNRADLIVIDDPVKSREEADSQTIRDKVYSGYLDDILTRKKPGAVEVIIMTRWHEDDLSGRILGEGWHGESGIYATEHGVDWNIIRIPAIADREDDPLKRKIGDYLWPKWFTAEFWRDIRRRVSPRTWSALYQQQPAPEDGDFFKRDDFRRFKLGTQPERLAIYMAADYAVSADKGDFTEIGAAGFDKDDNLWILDWWRGQKTPDVWIDKELDFVSVYKPFVSVSESGVIRQSTEPFLKKRARDRKIFFNKQYITSNVNKAANARSFQGMTHLGKVFLPNRPWADTLLDQLLQFPAGKYDDGVDVCGLFGRIIDQAFAPSTYHSAEPAASDEYHDNDEHDEGEESWTTA